MKEKCFATIGICSTLYRPHWGMCRQTSTQEGPHLARESNLGPCCCATQPLCLELGCNPGEVNSFCGEANVVFGNVVVILVQKQCNFLQFFCFATVPV